MPNSSLLHLKKTLRKWSLLALLALSILGAGGCNQKSDADKAVDPAEQEDRDPPPPRAQVDPTAHPDPTASDPPVEFTPGNDEADFVLQPVYYGTDRLPQTSRDERWQQYQSALRATLIAGGIALLTGVLCYFTKRKTIGLVTVLALALTWWLGRAALLEKQRAAADDLESNRRYGSDLHETALGVQTERGICLVSIPKTHQRGSGELEIPGLTEFKVDRAKHFDLLRVRLIPERDDFLARLAENVRESPRRQILVFVHGFNVSFDEAAMRTAQLSYDLDFEGPAAFFSWPSKGNTINYASDEDSVRATVPQLQGFLTDLLKETGAESVDLIAHSMGNRAVSEMLMSLERVRNSAGEPVLNQVIMAAPDISAKLFRTRIAPQIGDAARNFTLYASSKDIALLGSEVLRVLDDTRLGQGGDARQVLPGIQTIDATELPGEAAFQLSLGHSYFVHPAILQDLRYLFGAPEPGTVREWLKENPTPPSGSYWTFRPELLDPTP